MKKLALTCKAEEIKAIKDFYASLPEDSYLVSILKGLPEYCARQIENDFGYGPLEELDGSYGRERELSAKVNTLEVTVKNQGDKLEAAKNATDYQHKQYEDMATGNKILRETYNELYAEKDQLAEQLEARDLEIMKLKARLFDLLDK